VRSRIVPARMQELVAAIVTSILGVVAALVVSKSDRHREERAGAYARVICIHHSRTSPQCILATRRPEKNGPPP